MSKSTISTFQLFELFPDEETARLYLEDRLWPNGPMCPDCKSGERVAALGVCATRKAGFYRCAACEFDFTIRTNTIFERSKVPLHKWIYAMYLLVTSRKGISSMQLAKEIGVTQKTAWFVLGRLREACGGDDLTKLSGVIEIDECFVGGKEGNKHEHKKLHAGRGSVGKATVLGMRERGGRTRAKVITDRTLDAIHGEIHGGVEVGSQLYTDDHMAFNRVLLESEDISKSCYRAESFFDGRLIVAHCFKVNTEGCFYLNDQKSDVEREIRIGTGRIITVT